MVKTQRATELLRKIAGYDSHKGGWHQIVVYEQELKRDKTQNREI